MLFSDDRQTLSAQNSQQIGSQGGDPSGLVASTSSSSRRGRTAPTITSQLKPGAPKMLAGQPPPLWHCHCLRTVPS